MITFIFEISFKAENKNYSFINQVQNFNGREKIYQQLANTFRTFSTYSNSYLQNSSSSMDCDSGKEEITPTSEKCNEIIRINRSCYIEKIQTPIPQYSDYGIIFKLLGFLPQIKKNDQQSPHVEF